jgi:ethanolamine ammonia-lyase large subunit
LGKRAAPEFEEWLERMRVIGGGKLLPVGERHRLLERVGAKTE